MTEVNTVISSLVVSGETEDIFKEALAELGVSERERVKNLIKERLLEIKRMERCLEKAKADLAKLLGRTPDEILMLNS